MFLDIKYYQGTSRSRQIRLQLQTVMFHYWKNY